MSIRSRASTGEYRRGWDEVFERQAHRATLAADKCHCRPDRHDGLTHEQWEILQACPPDFAAAGPTPEELAKVKAKAAHEAAVARAIERNHPAHCVCMPCLNGPGTWGEE